MSDIITTFRRRYVRPQSIATARCKWEQLYFDPTRQTFQDFLEQYQKLAQEAYGDDAPKFIETSFYAKMPAHLKRVLNQARLETESYDLMVQHLEREMELNGLLAPSEKKHNGSTPNRCTRCPTSNRQSTQTSRPVFRMWQPRTCNKELPENCSRSPQPRQQGTD